MMVVAPDVIYDSWVTIGATALMIFLMVLSTLFLVVGQVLLKQEIVLLLMMELVQGGTFYTPGGLNGVSGDDQKVLLCQLTTDGLISGSFSIQIFPEGDQINDHRVDFTFSQAPLWVYIAVLK